MRFVSATVLNIKSPTLKLEMPIAYYPMHAMPSLHDESWPSQITRTVHFTDACQIMRMLKGVYWLQVFYIVLQHASSRVQVRSTLKFPLVSLLEELERWSPFLAPARALHMTMINYRRFLQNLYPFKAAAHELQPKRNQNKHSNQE